jgi:16S rRNA (uracil1498-N3)-methyltransferase
MNIFYCPSAEVNDYAPLDDNEYQHVVKVLRKKENEELYVFNGAGKLFEARITGIDKKRVLVHLVRIVETDAGDRPRLHIAVAPPKNIERFEWFIEKATELGIDEITPLICQHSERRELKPERIEKILVSACKQCMKLTLPRLNPMMKYEEFVKKPNELSRKYIGYCAENTIHLKDAYHGGFDSVVMIGPEGDFTREEVLLAQQNEFEVVSLGKSRLRLETAAVFAAAVFNLANA